MEITIEERRLIATTGLQLIIVILFIWNYFKDKKDRKHMLSEIKRLDDKIKTFGCVTE